MPSRKASNVDSDPNKPASSQCGKKQDGGADKQDSGVRGDSKPKAYPHGRNVSQQSKVAQVITSTSEEALTCKVCDNTFTSEKDKLVECERCE